MTAQAEYEYFRDVYPVKMRERGINVYDSGGLLYPSITGSPYYQRLNDLQHEAAKEESAIYEKKFIDKMLGEDE